MCNISEPCVGNFTTKVTDQSSSHNIEEINVQSASLAAEEPSLNLVLGPMWQVLQEVVRDMRDI